MTKKHQYPLRKVIQRNVKGTYKDMQFNQLNVLACGHMVPPVTDIYGQTSSVRQRCRLCWEMRIKVGEADDYTENGGMRSRGKRERRDRVASACVLARLRGNCDIVYHVHNKVIIACAKCVRNLCYVK